MLVCTGNRLPAAAHTPSPVGGLPGWVAGHGCSYHVWMADDCIPQSKGTSVIWIGCYAHFTVKGGPVPGRREVVTARQQSERRTKGYHIWGRTRYSELGMLNARVVRGPSSIVADMRDVVITGIVGLDFGQGPNTDSWRQLSHICRAHVMCSTDPTNGKLSQGETFCSCGQPQLPASCPNPSTAYQFSTTTSRQRAQVSQHVAP